MTLPRPTSLSVPSEALTHNLLIVLLAALLCFPCLLKGIPPSGDADLHTAYQYHFSRQFWSGDLYPRWLMGENKGFGSPYFLVQYPLPYFVTALLRPITAFPATGTREARELGVFFFLTLGAAGLVARVWFRKRCTPNAATLAAVVYISLPYILGRGIYFSAALGELCAFVWMPLALALCDTLEPRFLSVSALAVVSALLLLSHLISAILFTPLLVCYAIASRSEHVPLTPCVASVLLSLAMGISLAAVYVFPLLAYRHLFDLNAMRSVMPALELGRGFVYITAESVARRFFAFVVTVAVGFTLVVALRVWRAGGGFVSRACMMVTLGLGMVVLTPDLGPRLILLSGLRVSSFFLHSDLSARMLLTGLFTVGLGCLAYCRVSAAATKREQVLLTAVCGAFFLMLPWSGPIWKVVPQLDAIQFPFRFAAIVTVAGAGLFAAAVDDGLRQRASRDARPSLIWLGVAAVAVVGTGALTWRLVERFRNPETVHQAMARNVDTPFRSYVPREHVAGFAQDLGVALDSFDPPLTPFDDTVRATCTRGDGVANVARVRPRELRVSAQCDEGRVRITQLYFPLWRVGRGPPGSDRAVLGSSPDGLIEVEMGGGRHDLELVFDGGWPERLGVIVSVASVTLVVGGAGLSALRIRAPVATKTKPDAPDIR